MRIRVKRLKAVDCLYYEHQVAPYVQFNLAALTSLASLTYVVNQCTSFLAIIKNNWGAGLFCLPHEAKK